MHHHRNREWLVYIALYLLFAAVYIDLATSATTQGLLTGEEVSVSIRDPLFWRARLQHNPMATNWAAHAIYAIGAPLCSDSIYAGRMCKALLMALLPMVIYGYGRRRLRWSPITASAAAISAGLLPGITAYAWIATEYGLTLALTLTAIGLADSMSTHRRVAAAALVALAGLVYPPGLYALPVVLMFTLLRLRHVGTCSRDVITLVRSLLAAAFILCVPRLWWTNPSYILTGGGSIDFSGSVARIVSLLQACVSPVDQYYYFAMDPPLVVPAWGIICGVGLGLGLCTDARRTWPLAALIMISLAAYGIAGGVPGVRRALIVVLGLHLFGIYAIDRLLVRIAAEHQHAARIVATVILLLMTAIQGLLTFDYRAHLNAHCGHIHLPRDFRFVLPVNVSMQHQLDVLYAEAGDPAWRAPAGYEHDRLYALLLHLAYQRNDSARISLLERRLFAP